MLKRAWHRLTREVTVLHKDGVGELVTVLKRRSGDLVQMIWWPDDTRGEHSHLDHLPYELMLQTCRELITCDSAGEARVVIEAAFEQARDVVG